MLIAILLLQLLLILTAAAVNPGKFGLRIERGRDRF
jgi:hypothetical protein